MAALINGTKRGLFSNEAGQGTAPNAAATATVAHPIQQGLVQSLGVFVDTIIVCTMTAIVILSAGSSVYTPGALDPSQAASLTQKAVVSALGGWAEIPMALIITVLAFSSVLAAASYSEVAVNFISPKKGGRIFVRVLSVVSTVLGALATLELVWNSVDVMMAIMTATNLLALIWLAKWVSGALRDWESQRRDGVKTPVFVGKNNPNLPADVKTNVWETPAS